MTPAQINQILHDKERTQESVALAAGLPSTSRNQVSQVIHGLSRSSRVELAIADATGLALNVLFPDWYDASGKRLRAARSVRTPPSTESSEAPESNAVGQRFKEERIRLGYTTASDLAAAVNAVPSTVSKSESGWTLPSAELLTRLAGLGADVPYILTGERSKPMLVLEILFGKSLPHQEPVHLLGAGLCLLNACCDYTADLNPYPPKSPHHAGVETGWRMARAAITGDVTQLPGVL